MGEHTKALLTAPVADDSAPSSAGTFARVNRTLARLVLVAAACACVVPAAIADSPPAAAAAATASVTCAPQPTGGAATAAPLLSYRPINPVRLVDTRNNIAGVNAPIERGCTLIVSVGAAVPAEAQAIALSLTAVNSEADYFTVYPCAVGRPDTSNLNAREGFATPNLVVAIPDVNRQVCIYSHGRSDVIVDLSGWWSNGSNRFGSIAPQRVYDSRRAGFAPLQRFKVREVRIPTSVVPEGTTAAVVNLTAANAVAAGFVTAFPCGQPAPNASNVNFLADEARAVGAIVGLGLGNTLCVMADTTVHIIVDVTGYYAPAPPFGPTAVVEPTAGRRVVDSRNGIGGPRQALAAGEVRAFDPVVGLADGDDAAAVMLNFVSTDAAAPGFLTAYPCGGAVPDVSTLNYVAGEAATNLATIELGSDRRVCVVSSVATNVIVDVFAVMTTPAGSPFERLSFDKPVWPSFNAEAVDYAIECGVGAASITMHLDLLPFASATLSVAGAQPLSVGTGTRTFVLRTDQPFVLSTTRREVRRDYHFRCVPTDFPRLDVDRPGEPAAGWYLTTSGFVSPNPSVNGPYLVILDHYGAPVWYKRTPVPMMDAKRLSDGRLAFTPSYGPFGIDARQGYWLSDLAGTSTTKQRTVDGLLTDHHDYVELPGGPDRRALVSYPIRTGVTPLLPYGAPNNTYSDGVIQEVDGSDAELWRWTMSEHFDPAAAPFAQNFESTPGFAGTGWDVFHINAIDRQPDGDYVVTARHLDGVFRVNHDPGQPDDGEVLWTLGTPASTDPAAQRLTIVGDPYGGPKRPHDGRLNGDVVTMFDNQAGMPGRRSRAVAYEIDIVAGTATMLWERRSDANYTGDTLGSVRVSGDGSVLINWSAGLQPIIDERTAAGVRLMSIGMPNGGNSYRTVKYPLSDFDIDELRATAGGTMTAP